MVNFTRPINNGDMVKGLDQLLQRNLDMLATLEHVDEDLGSAQGGPAAVPALKHMHKQHVDRMAETIRALGGAPAQHGDGRRWVSEGKLLLSKLGDDNAALSAIRSEEEKLGQEYEAKLQELSSSPESVKVIQELLEDERRQIQHLHAATTGNKGKGE